MAVAGRIIDTAVHPALPDAQALREYMAEPFRSRSFFPGPTRQFYPPSSGEFRTDSAPDGRTQPGSDLGLLRRHVLEDGGADLAILLPRTRGLLPDNDLATEICAATNRWQEMVLATEEGAGDAQLLGSIRINPQDPGAAIKEIDRWCDHPRMVQVAVPVQSHHPYGQRMYYPIWEAAAERGLPVAIVADAGTGIELWPTMAGYPRNFVEYATQYPLSFMYHLISLLAEGVLANLPALRVVFADGGFEVLAPIMWRFDKDWRGCRWETPWLTEPPSFYVTRQVRFTTTGFENLENVQVDRWCDVSDAARLLLFASHYPSLSPFVSGLLTNSDGATRDAILGANARDWYRLGESAAGESCSERRRSR
ncbi:amidohydrolase family protein [Pseudonocardia sp. GCM10023141]|uniref:amidohydrolase family protein n=1 Tax=Pseudonocardia sp. GCM10023141 TaxID=3252653 RepID=UPI0036134E1C